MSDYTEQLREFWRSDTFEKARDELVTSPSCPQAYTDRIQGEYLSDLLQGIDFHSGNRVLDYGCGIGRVSRALLHRGAIVTAVDVSPEMLRFCRDYCRHDIWLETGLTEGYGCPWIEDNRLDGAICLYVLQHCPSLEMAASILADLHRVLRPGGWLICQSTDHGQQADGTVGFTGERQSRTAFLRMVADAELEIDLVREDGGQTVVTASKTCPP